MHSVIKQYRLKTDIEFGVKFGMKTLLVFTGAISRQDAMASLAEKATKLQYFADSVAGFLTCSPSS